MNPYPPPINSVISPPPKFDVRNITVCDKSTRRLSPNVNVALSSIPNNNCHSASLAFSISSNNRSEEHTSELQSHSELVCRLLLEKKNPQRERAIVDQNLHEDF